MPLPAPDPAATCVITGASAGIGEQLARQLAARGHGLTLVARRRERLEELGEELRARHGVAVAVHDCDLADDAARGALIEALRTGERRVDVLCNNAGYGSFGRFHEQPPEREVAMVRVNVVALHELTAAFLPGMVERGAGAVLDVGSLAGFQPGPHNATYAATKAFVNSFSEAVASELAGTGVSMTVLCPGPVATEFSDAAGVGDIDGRLPAFMWQTAAEVARAGIEGMERGKRMVFPGLAHNAVAQAGRFVPRSLLLPAWARLGGRVLERD
jgi:short-subunit dehydrogenase